MLFNISFHVSVFIFHLPLSIRAPFYWNPDSLAPRNPVDEAMPLSLPMLFIMQTSNSFKFYYSLCFHWHRLPSVRLLLPFFPFHSPAQCSLCSLLSHSGVLGIQSHLLNVFICLFHISTRNVKCACIRCVREFFITYTLHAALPVTNSIFR